MSDLLRVEWPEGVALATLTVMSAWVGA